MQDKLIVKRNEGTGLQTLGEMTFGDFKCKTLELPWLNNQSKISCIPYGQYTCEKKYATAAIPYQHVTILNVPNRSGIAIHKANYYTQLRGCIAVGENQVDINKDGQKDVTNSGSTFDKLMELLPKRFTLIII
jgi:hypothetical protein